MKVLIVTNMAPFIWGGAEELAYNLRKNLEHEGHQSEILRIPFQWDPINIVPSQMLMVRALEISNVDHVISLKFPAYLLEFPRKSLWLIHQFRQIYDLFESNQSQYESLQGFKEVQGLIKSADNDYFSQLSRLYCISEVTRQRLQKFNGFNATVLIPPVNDPELFNNKRNDGYIFAGGRINSMKRQHLLLEAMQYADPSVKLIIAGPPDTHSDGVLLETLVQRFNLGDRVKLDLGFLPKKKYADYINYSNAIACIPVDEDMGYFAMEAALSYKPIITTNDSGGILTIAKNRESGWVVEPMPESIGSAMSEAINQPRTSIRYGSAAYEILKNLDLNWPRAIEALLK